MITADVSFNPSMELIKAREMGNMQTSYTFDPNIQNIRMLVKEILIRRKMEFGKAEIYFLSMITDDASSEPIKMQTQIFENIGRNDYLPLGPEGFTVYRNPTGKMPRFIDYRFFVIESDQAKRDIGEVLGNMDKKDEYKNAKESVLALTGLASPQITLINSALNILSSLVVSFFRGNKDDQLFYLQGSYDAVFDDLGAHYGPVIKGNQYVQLTYEVQKA